MLNQNSTLQESINQQSKAIKKLQHTIQNHLSRLNQNQINELKTSIEHITKENQQRKSDYNKLQIYFTFIFILCCFLIWQLSQLNQEQNELKTQITEKEASIDKISKENRITMRYKNIFKI